MVKVRKRKNQNLSVAAQIESTPEIRLREMAWRKNPRQKLVEVGYDRQSNKVSITRHTGMQKMLVHSHVNSTKKNLPRQLTPSLNDLAVFSLELFSKPRDARTHVIAAVNRRGKVIGYNFIRATRKLWKSLYFKKYLKDPRVKRLFHLAVGIVYFDQYRTKQTQNEIRRILKELGVRTRIVRVKAH